MTIGALLLWLVVGGVVGWAAPRLIAGPHYELPINIAVGVVAGLVGGYLVGLLGATSAIVTTLAALVVAAGALYAASAIARQGGA